MVAVLLVVGASPAFAQQATQGDRALAEVTRLLELKVERFVAAGNAFGDYARSLEDPTQLLLVASLGIEAERAAASVQGTRIMLALYTYTSCHPARASARAMVQDWLNFYTRSLDTSVARVTDSLSTAQMAVVVVSASRLKDDLQETIALLKSIRLP
jgi:hypothetical protein